MARSEQIQKFLLIPRFCDSSSLVVFPKPKAFSASPFVGVIRISTRQLDIEYSQDKFQIEFDVSINSKIMRILGYFPVSCWYNPAVKP